MEDDSNSKSSRLTSGQDRAESRDGSPAGSGSEPARPLGTSPSLAAVPQSQDQRPDPLPAIILPTLNFHDEIGRWKSLYESCLVKLEQLRSLQAEQAEHADAAEAVRCLERLRDEVAEAVAEAERTLSYEHALIEAALGKHKGVLLDLLGRLKVHAPPDRVDSIQEEIQQLQAPLQDLLPQQSRAPRSSTSSAGSDDVISDQAIQTLRDLINEHDILTAAVDAERAKQRQMDASVRDCRDARSMRCAEDKLRRTNSLLQLQVKRLQYELCRLTQAQATEVEAVSLLLGQSAAELERNLAHDAELSKVHEQLQEGTRFAISTSGCQELYRHASRNSFVESLEELQLCKERHSRLERRLQSYRVYREVDELDDEKDVLHCIDLELCKGIEDLNEAERTLTATWAALRLERDELTAHLHPDLQRLQELQEIAKEKLELETKLHKEHFLFKKQLEDFQKDLLEVETDLLTGNINRKARATKNIVDQLLVLRDIISKQNMELREELRERGLSISPTDSLASAVLGEDEFRQLITDKMKKMELRIKEDLDRRALFKPKKLVFEAPGKAKIPFRGQRNVIKVPSKAASDWRRKTTAEIHKQDAMERQVENLRREILNKLSLEKEKAKQRLLQYESQRLSAPPSASGGLTLSQALPRAVPVDEMRATQELRVILGQLDAFLRRTRRGRDAEGSTSRMETETNAEPPLEDDFGHEMRTLVLQLEKLQNALEGSSARERERKVTALERGRELFDQLPDAEAGADAEDSA